MNNIKAIILVAIFAVAMSNPQKVEAKETVIGHVWKNDCVATITKNSILFGLIKWVTVQVVACPEGVSAPEG